ncbi:Uncharacterised protein [Mycobacteroides abscessus subsp. massiliense]|nr:Uncharacterised protein [Mycobacteroides abscessus subsp. massiliense]
MNRTLRIPSSVTAMPISRMYSSAVSNASLRSQSNPSAGMQYVQRRLHRSVKDTRKSVAMRPNESINGVISPA